MQQHPLNTLNIAFQHKAGTLYVNDKRLSDFDENLGSYTYYQITNFLPNQELSQHYE